MTAGEVPDVAHTDTGRATSTIPTRSCERRSTRSTAGLFSSGDRHLFRPSSNRCSITTSSCCSPTISRLSIVSSASAKPIAIGTAGAHVHPEHRESRALFVGSFHPGVPSPHLERHAGPRWRRSLTSRGVAAPLGATVGRDGVNFSVFAKSAETDRAAAVRRCECGGACAGDPSGSQVTSDVSLLARLRPDLGPAVYGYRAHGPFAPERGLRFDPREGASRPYGLAVAVPDSYAREPRAPRGDNAATAMKSVVADPGRYDWEGDRLIRRPFAETIVYELHVGGFTRSQLRLARTTLRTYTGLDREDSLSPGSRHHRRRAAAGVSVRCRMRRAARVNYWGYQPVSASPRIRPTARGTDPLGGLDEFRTW